MSPKGIPQINLDVGAPTAQELAVVCASTWMPPRGRVEYAPTCPGCGSQDVAGKSVCSFCGEVLSRSITAEPWRRPSIPDRADYLTETIEFKKHEPDIDIPIVFNDGVLDVTDRALDYSWGHDPMNGETGEVRYAPKRSDRIPGVGERVKLHGETFMITAVRFEREPGCLRRVVLEVAR